VKEENPKAEKKRASDRVREEQKIKEVNK